MKKLIKSLFALLMVAALALSVTACTTKNDDDEDGVGTFNENGELKDANVKIGLICLHDDSSTYDKNFINSMYRALNNLGIQRTSLELHTGVGEDSSCLEKARELAATCNVVFADSFGHEDFMIQAAKQFPNVNFCHATGTKAHTENLDNYSNAFASIYEGRYLAGVAAGLKLNEMIKDGKCTAETAVMGYVGAFPYAEVVSGYTSFYLGAKSVCPTVTMKVRYTNSWYDFDAEKAAAEALINTDKCVLISQHADSYGAPEACEAAKVPNITYNGSTVSKCPNTYVVSSKIDWTPYFEYMIKQTVKGEKIDTDWTGTIATGSVKLNTIGKKAPASGTQAKIDEVKAKLQNGSVKVFDCSTFTVGGVHLTEYLADVDDDGTFTGETNVIKTVNGVTFFDESSYRSAPYFDLRIDGITEINAAS
ncbi:BMP family ABC transporter substrate-binding protein [bacterium]|nr:BMP family ABC transporter substrate-binding protein [bacterium]